MKTHTTNYINSFILVADDCPVVVGEIPPRKEKLKSIANLQFELISKNPYTYTSDDVIFQVYAERKDLTEDEYDNARKDFFSKGQACLRSSPLTKRNGWGIHFNHEGKVALFGIETMEYQKLLDDSQLTKIKAMRTKK